MKNMFTDTSQGFFFRIIRACQNQFQRHGYHFLLQPTVAAKMPKIPRHTTKKETQTAKGHPAGKSHGQMQADLAWLRQLILYEQ